MRKKKEILNKLNNLYGQNYSGEYVKEKINFDKKCRYVKIPNYCFHIWVVVLGLSICLLTLSVAFLAVDFDRRGSCTCDQGILDGDMVNYEDYYQELNACPIVSFEYKSGYSFNVYEALEKVTGEKIYFYKIEIDEADCGTENHIVIYVNNNLVVIRGKEVIGYLGKVDSVSVKITIGENTKNYNYDL